MPPLLGIKAGFDEYQKFPLSPLHGVNDVEISGTPFYAAADVLKRVLCSITVCTC
jgi:hypothetical protein